MEKLEELKKKLQCEYCHETYSEQKKPYTCNSCKHHMCYTCGYYDYTCPICGVQGNPYLHSVSTDFTMSVEAYESLLTNSAGVEEDLRNEISTLKQELAQREAPKTDYYNCAECESVDAEQNLQLCQTCHELKFEDHEDLKKNALCAPCAIKKHMRKGHQTVDFFPYFSAYNFSSKSSKIKSESEELINARDLLNNTLSDFNVLSINVSESYDVLTEMARRSKSTKIQVEFVEKMETFINESKSIHVGADSELKKRSKLLQDNLTIIKEWYNARMGNCVDDSETIKL